MADSRTPFGSGALLIFADIVNYYALCASMGAVLLSKLTFAAAGVAFDGHDDTDANHRGHHRGAAMADKGQGQTCHRRKAHHHEQIDHDVKEQRASEACGNELAITAAAIHRHSQAPAHQVIIEKQNDQPAH